jgi:hypothetical protein
MPGAIIAIDQDRPGPISTGSPGVARNDLWLGRTIRPRCTTSGNTTFAWTLLDKPPGSGVTISNADQIICAVSAPDLPGTYRLQLITNGGGPGNSQVLVMGVTKDNAGVTTFRGWRPPAFGEVPPENNFSGTNTRGWAEAIEFILGDIETFLQTPIAVGLSIPSAATGDLLYYNGTSWTRFAPGTAGRVLTSAGPGVAPVWSPGGGTATDLNITSQTTGDFVYFNGANWVRFTPGAAGRVLTSAGAGVAPVWNVPSTIATDLSLASQAQGDVVYFNGSNWVRLAAGAAGQILETRGASANPQWADPRGLAITEIPTDLFTNPPAASTWTALFGSPAAPSDIVGGGVAFDQAKGAPGGLGAVYLKNFAVSGITHISYFFIRPQLRQADNTDNSFVGIAVYYPSTTGGAAFFTVYLTYGAGVPKITQQAWRSNGSTNISSNQVNYGGVFPWAPAWWRVTTDAATALTVERQAPGGEWDTLYVVASLGAPFIGPPTAQGIIVNSGTLVNSSAVKCALLSYVE